MILLLIEMKNIFERINAPTPKWFKRVRTIGLMLTAVSVALLTAPISLPAAVVTVAGYIATAGSVAVAVSQTAVNSETDG